MKTGLSEYIPRHVRTLAAHLAGRGITVYPVGGAVRDLLLRRQPKEWDLAAATEPGRVMDALPKAIPTGIKHGTVTALWEGHAIEITSFRSEAPGSYKDGRHPERVTFGVTLEEDLSRRDFTINAMAIDLVTGVLIDPFNGRADLQRRVIRCVGKPALRFAEDGLRLMRAVRFAAFLGFAIHRATRQAIPLALPVFKRVSAERIRDEMLKMLCAARPSRGIELMRRTGILTMVIPELIDGFGMKQNRWHHRDVYHHALKTMDETRETPLLRLAALLHDIAKPRCIGGEEPDHTFYGHDREGSVLARHILTRLKFSRAETDFVASLIANHMFSYSPDWKDGTVRRFVARVGKASVPDILELQRADIVARGTHVKSSLRSLELLRRRIGKLSRASMAIKASDLAVDGRDVMRLLKIPPGPRVGTVLGCLLERVIDDPALNRRRTLLDLIRREAY